jgi:DNA topoisomerase I
VTQSLVEVDCTGPGLRRRRAGRGFTYFDEDGERITDPAVIRRLKALAIPPAWQDVWICPDPRGHIQAVGFDDRGRRQYRYHDEWRTARDREKHERVLRLAGLLPRLRERTEADLAQDGMGRDRVVAAAVRLLELGLFRVGGEEYADENSSYGLATLHKGHVRLGDDEAVFSYPAKSQKRRVVTIRDPEVVPVLRALKRRRGGGSELLAYKDDRGRWVDLRSDDINGYIHDVASPELSAKDVRTWWGTVLAAVALAGEADVDSEAEQPRAVARAVRAVAHQLGNTPAVTRKSYVDPRVIDRFHEGETIEEALGDGDSRPAVDAELAGEIEEAVIELLDRKRQEGQRGRKGQQRRRRRTTRPGT